MPYPRRRPTEAGVTLPELLIVLTILSTLIAISFSGFRDMRNSLRIHAAARAVWSQLALARTVALGRRETVRVTREASGDLVVLDAAGRRLASASVGRDGELALDSLRLRPATLRFNARGQAAPGSVYLHLGGRTVRVVSNFLGRLRIEASSGR